MSIQYRGENLSRMSDVDALARQAIENDEQLPDVKFWRAVKVVGVIPSVFVANLINGLGGEDDYMSIAI